MSMQDSGLGFDALLQLSRRVDWRFLLPHPHLGHVGLLGQHEQLTQSLLPFCVKLSTGSTYDLQQNSGLYDVVVIPRANHDNLHDGAQLVRAGGVVYAELSAKRWPIRSLTRYRSLLQAMNYSDVRCFWHWPNFEAPTKLIPLNDPAALALAMLPQSSSLIHKLVKPFLTQPLFFAAAPCVSIVAQRSNA